MANEYDKIFRKNLFAPGPAILKAITGFDIGVVHPFPPRVRKTVVEKETDSLYLIKEVGKKDFILHFEYQSTNDHRMIKRMAAYDYMTLLQYDLDVKSAVVYTGDKKLSMKEKLVMGESIYKCKVIDIKSLDPQLFLQSDNPKEIIFALLAGNNKEDKVPVVREIFIRLNQLLQDNDRELIELIKELESLSVLRGETVQKLILKQEDIMPIYIDVRKDLRFKQGKEEGKQETIIEIARTLLKQGCTIPFVHKCTRLPIAELNKLSTINE